MFKVKSTVGRMWPAYGIEITLGENQIPDGDATRRNLIERLLAPYHECGQMVVERVPDKRPKAEESQPGESEAALASPKTSKK
jgi:hypothetical protein